jgi:acyl-CoA reductase-like NAD-dependent aldehyde dehydrogenase
VSISSELRLRALNAVVTNEKIFPKAEKVKVFDPYTAELIAEVAKCGIDEVSQACVLAEKAFKRGMPLYERIAVLERLASILTARDEDFAAVITLESGKCIRDSRIEVRRAIETVKFTAAEARTVASRVIPTDVTEAGFGSLALEKRIPRGVVAAITPFNFPLNTVVHKVAPAIAVGCTVVLKPAHQTPLTALLFQQCALEAGLGKDWLQVVTDGDGSAGAALVENLIPSVISFTGSSRVGWSIAAKSPRKKTLLELGSNAPVIVTESADIEDAAEKIVTGAYAAGGQSCISVQRVFVHRSIHEKFQGIIVAKVAQLKAADPFEESTSVGPLITVEASQRVNSWIDEAEAAGASILVGGSHGQKVNLPTIVANAPLGTKLREQEVFGPVFTLLVYDSFSEAINLANETIYGLQAGVFTHDLSQSLAAFESLAFGGVLINDIPTSRLDQQPYGGVSESGNTREGPHYAMHELTDVRMLRMRSTQVGSIK